MATYNTAQEAILQRIIVEAEAAETTAEEIGYLGGSLREVGGTAQPPSTETMSEAYSTLLAKIEILSVSPTLTPEELSSLSIALAMIGAQATITEFTIVAGNAVQLVVSTANQAVFDINALKTAVYDYLEQARDDVEGISVNVGLMRDQTAALRTEAQGARDASIAARTASETASGVSIAARDVTTAARDVTIAQRVLTESAKDASVAAQVKSESARDVTLAYRNEAQVARVDANAARDLVFTYRADTLAYRDAAAASAASAASNDATGVINAHMANQANPHATTAAQVGAYTKAETDTKISAATPAPPANMVTNVNTSTDNTLARYDGVTGKALQGSGVTVSDTGAMSIATSGATGNLIEVLNGAQVVFGANINGSFTLRGSGAVVYLNWFGNDRGGSLGLNGSLMQLNGSYQSNTDSTNIARFAAFNSNTVTSFFQLFDEGVANIMAQRNGANPQAYRIYNSYGSTVNFERGVFDWKTTANVLTIGSQAGGTGTLRGIELVGASVSINAPARPQGDVTTAAASTAFVAGEIGTRAPTVHTHTAAQISDASADGKTWLKAANLATMKTLLALVKADVGLSNVENYSAASLPLSTAATSALAGKAASVHTHALDDVSGLVSALASKMATGTAIPISQVSDLTAALTAKVETSAFTAAMTQANLRAVVGTGTMAYRNVTISTATPSGGADGDVWFKVA